MSFHVGQKVVCVRGAWRRPRHPDETYPKNGLVYTVRATLIVNEWQYLCFHEIRNPDRMDDGEIAFGSFHFRPIVERKTDISIFQKMLTDAPKETEAAE